MIHPMQLRLHVCASRYHRVAGEWALKFEDFVEASSLGFLQFLRRHLDHKAHSGVRVVFLEVCDQSRDLLCAVQHRLQHVLLVGLDQREQSEMS